MPEPDVLSDGNRGNHCQCLERGWRAARRFVAMFDAVARRAIAQPAQSAVATAAFGLIVGTVLRTAVLRHGGPNSAAGSGVSHVAPVVPVKSIKQEPARGETRTGGGDPRRGGE